MTVMLVQGQWLMTTVAVIVVVLSPGYGDCGSCGGPCGVFRCELWM
jgi:hypothetical protein